MQDKGRLLCQGEGSLHIAVDCKSLEMFRLKIPPPPQFLKGDEQDDCMDIGVPHEVEQVRGSIDFSRAHHSLLLER
jgi:hypothetical protein